MRITIVDDGIGYVKALEAVLTEAGHEVTCIFLFRNGLDACVSKIQKSKPNLVMLDHELGTTFTGEDIAANLDNFTLIGISTENQQTYCQKHYKKKVELLKESTSVTPREELLSLL